MISGIILARNSEKSIEKSIRSLGFCGEVLVINDMSDDDTAVIASKCGARVIDNPLNMDFAAQHNFAEKHSKGDWVLFIDSDEIVSADLAKEINDKTATGLYGAWKFKRTDLMWGKWLKYGEIGSFRAVRLYKKGSGKWVRRVHEKFITNMKPGNMKNPILHYPHSDLKKLVNSINKWSTLHAISNNEEEKRSTLLKIVFYPHFHFMKNYIFRLGFLDGLQGFVLAMVMAGHSFLAWSKLMVLQKRRIQALADADNFKL